MIQFDENRLMHALGILQHLPDEIPKTVSRVLNRAAESGRTEAVRQAREEYMVQAGRARETINIRRASTSNLSATIRASGRPIPLMHFKTNPRILTRTRPINPLFAQVKRGGGGNIRGAFVAKMRSGHIGVFNRIGSGRNIIQRYGPSFAQRIDDPAIREMIENKAKETLDKRLEHEINRILMR